MLTRGEGLASVMPPGLVLPKMKWLWSRVAAAAARRGGRARGPLESVHT